MSPLTAGNVDSHFITYSLTNNNGVRTAIIPEQNFPAGMDRLVGYIGQCILIRSRKDTNFALDHCAGNGFGSLNDTIIYQVGGGDANRKFIVDNKGRIICFSFRTKCLYRNPANNRIIPKLISSIAENDGGQYWGLNSAGQLHARDNPTIRIEVNNGNMWNDRLITYAANISRSDNADKWNIEVAQNNELIIRRGVMDENGVIYKLTGIVDNALADMSSYAKVTIPHWNLRNFTTFTRSFPAGAREIKFRDTYAIKKIGDTCKRWVFMFNNFYIDCGNKLVKTDANITSFTDIQVGSETSINNIIKINNTAQWVVCNSPNIYYRNSDTAAFTRYTVQHLETVQDLMYANSYYYACGRVAGGTGAVIRTNNLTTWEKVCTASCELHMLAYFSGGTTYVAASKSVTGSATQKVFKSVNGTTWAGAYTVTWGINCISEVYTRTPSTYGSNRFVLATGNGIWLESTGSTTFITQTNTNTSNINFRAACVFNDRLCVCGDNGKFMSGFSSNIANLTYRTIPTNKNTTQFNYYTHTNMHGLLVGNNSTILYCRNELEQTQWVDESPPQDLGNFVDVTVMTFRWTVLSDQGYIYTKYLAP